MVLVCLRYADRFPWTFRSFYCQGRILKIKICILIEHLLLFNASCWTSIYYVHPPEFRVSWGTLPKSVPVDLRIASVGIFLLLRCSDWMLSFCFIRFRYCGGERGLHHILPCPLLGCKPTSSSTDATDCHDAHSLLTFCLAARSVLQGHLNPKGTLSAYSMYTGYILHRSRATGLREAHGVRGEGMQQL
jgi:hypothetical protein